MFTFYADATFHTKTCFHLYTSHRKRKFGMMTITDYWIQMCDCMVFVAIEVSTHTDIYSATFTVASIRPRYNSVRVVTVAPSVIFFLCFFSLSSRHAIE